jgi:hypothetical protein
MQNGEVLVLRVRIKLAIGAAVLSLITSFFFSSVLGMLLFVIGVGLSISSLKSRYAKLALTLNLCAGALHAALIVYLYFTFTPID